MKDLLEILNKDPKANVAILNHIDDAKSIEYKISNGVAIVRVIRGTDGKDTSIYIAGDGEMDLDCIKGFLKPDDHMFCCVDDRYFELLKAQPYTSWEERCFRFVYPNSTIEHTKKYKVEKIKDKDITIVDKNWTYTGDWSYDYLKYRIDNDVNGAIYIDDEIAGWCVSHSDGSIGTLFVLDKFRNRGLAIDIMVAMTEMKLERGKLPFLFTVAENIKSINLVEKLGYDRYQKVFWMGIRGRLL